MTRYRVGVDWTIDSDVDGWYLEYWYTGEYWTNRTRVKLDSVRFEDAVIEARNFLNLE